MNGCVFCRIIKGELPSRKVYEDGDIVSFHDIHPLAPVHFLIMPKEHVGSIAELTDGHRDVIGKIMVLAGRLAKEQGCEGGFRIIINTGEIARQEVPHLHVHVIGGGEVLPPMIVHPK